MKGEEQWCFGVFVWLFGFMTGGTHSVVPEVERLVRTTYTPLVTHPELVSPLRYLFPLEPTLTPTGTPVSRPVPGPDTAHPSISSLEI